MRNFLASRGVHAILQGQEQWCDVHQAWLYESLEERIGMYYFEISYQKDPGQPADDKAFDVFTSARIWAYAVCCRRQREASYFGRLTRTFFPNDMFVPKRWRSIRHLEPFFIWLLEKCERPDGRPILPSDFNYGPYGGIVEHWDGPENSLAAALIEGCEYHCQRMFSTGNSEEFYPMPYTLVPVEILAVRMVRDQLGLITPQVKHPLLDTNCGQIRGSPADVIDPLAAALEAKLQILTHQLSGPIIPFASP
jgi:hypothetical protein